MRKIKRLKNPPENSTISKDFKGYHYCDSYCIITQTDKSLDKITTDIFQTPKWADVLLRIRNAVVKIVGLDSGGTKDQRNYADYYPIGSRAVYFTVIDRNDQEILMEEKDKHLNFRVSVMVNRKKSDVKIFVTTIVKYNRFLGRLYFFPVKPFHKMIVRSLLKRFLKQASNN